VAATRSIASRARSGLLTRTFDIGQLLNRRNWAMVGASDGYRAVPVSRQLTPGLILLLPGMAGSPPFIFFSTNYPELAATFTQNTTASVATENCLNGRVHPKLGVAVTVAVRCLTLTTFQAFTGVPLCAH
jgi:hypothetical protein